MEMEAFYQDYLRPIAVVFVFVALLALNKLVFQKLFRHHDNKFILQRSISLFLAFAALIAFILFLPIKESIQGQILSVIAIIISAGIALSSTTVLGNIIAGLMNNSMNRFNNGDLIQIGEVQGRLVRKSPFHIEVQTEDSNFVTIPNLHVATHPVKLTRKSNTVISTTVSLGYDVPRLKVEAALKAAAEAAELKDPYVFIIRLGDFSITYKIHGFLGDSSAYFSASSRLHGQILDELHKANIEIVSPTFMNQRQVGDQVFIPESEPKREEPIQESLPEEQVFDAAMKSEALEERKKAIDKLRENLKNIQKSGRDIPSERIDQLKNHIQLLREKIEEEERKAEKER